MAISEKLRKTLEKRKQQIIDRGKGFGYQTFKVGKRAFRPLNPGEDEDFAVEVTMFFFGKEIGGFVSPISFGDPCAANEAYEELKSSKDPDDNKLAAKFKPRKKFMTVALWYKDPSAKEIDLEVGKKGVDLALLAQTQYSELIDWMLDEDYGDFTDEKNGYPIKVTREGEGQYDTNYLQKKLANSKLPKEYRGVYNTEEMVKKIIPSYEKTEEMLNEFLGLGKKKKKKGDKDKKGKSKDKSGKSKDKSGKKKKKRSSDI